MNQFTTIYKCKESRSYYHWSNIWGENEYINCIFNYLIEIREELNPKKLNTIHLTDLIEIYPGDLIDLFEKHIGDSEEINTQRYNFLHPTYKKEVFDKYLDRHKRYFKLIRVLDEKI